MSRGSVVDAQQLSIANPRSYRYVLSFGSARITLARPAQKGFGRAPVHYCLMLCGPTHDTTEMRALRRGVESELRFPGLQRW